MAGTAEGRLKQLAARSGLSVEDYQARLDSGERWCFACCTFHRITAFHIDRSRNDGVARICREAKNRKSRARHVPVPPEKRKPMGPPPEPPRGGDVKQARQRINVLVRTGHLPHPNTLPCSDCGHGYTPDERRHEYDHYLGYAAEHHYDVQAVCTICHRKRGDERGETGQIRGYRGRFTAH
jgi:hypothetical protein